MDDDRRRTLREQLDEKGFGQRYREATPGNKARIVVFGIMAVFWLFVAFVAIAYVLSN